jgi:hypothetical protein
MPVFKFIFNLILSPRNILTLWKQAPVVPVFKKSKQICNWKLQFEFYSQKIFSSILIENDQVSRDFTCIFISVSMDTLYLNIPLPILRHLEFMTPLVFSQSQVDSIYFELKNASYRSKCSASAT